LLLDLVPVALDLIGTGDGHVPEHVRMPPDQLGHDPVGDVVDGEPGAVVALGRDPGVEHDLQQDVAKLLAEGLLVIRLERLERLVRLLEQVRRQRRMGLAGVPRAVEAQAVHGGDEVDQVGAGQVRRTPQQLSPGRNRWVGVRLGQPHGNFVRDEQVRAGLLRHPVRDPGSVEGGQLGMPGRREHGVGGAQRLPGWPAEQTWCHPRAGRQDDQHGGAVPDGEAVGAGPAVPDTGLGAETTWYGGWE
jgi:hypothetical protein